MVTIELTVICMVTFYCNKWFMNDCEFIQCSARFYLRFQCLELWGRTIEFYICIYIEQFNIISKRKLYLTICTIAVQPRFDIISRIMISNHDVSIFFSKSM